MVPLPLLPLPAPAELDCRMAAGVAEGPNTTPFTAPSSELSSADGRSATGGVDAGMITGGAVPRLPPRLEGFLAAGFAFGLARPEPFDFAGARRTGEDERDDFRRVGRHDAGARMHRPATGAGALCPAVPIGRPV